MSPYTVILTDFGAPDRDLESQVVQASGLDLNETISKWGYGL